MLFLHGLYFEIKHQILFEWASEVVHWFHHFMATKNFCKIVECEIMYIKHNIIFFGWLLLCNATSSILKSSHIQTLPSFGRHLFSKTTSDFSEIESVCFRGCAIPPSSGITLWQPGKFILNHLSYTNVTIVGMDLIFWNAKLDVSGFDWGAP